MGLVQRIGVNLNKAVAKLNATGQAGPDLESSAASGPDLSCGSLPGKARVAFCEKCSISGCLRNP